VEQDGLSQVVEPVKRNQDAVSFYDYYSASGHTPFMEDSVAKLYLYEDLGSGQLSLVIHHHREPGYPSEILRADFDFTGVPAGVYVAVSDDPDHQWDPPRGQELDLTLEPEGHWQHGQNSDGGVLSDFPTSEPWCFTITPSNWQGIKEWRYVESDGSEFVLDMQKPVTICAFKGTPSYTQWSLVLLILVVAGFLGYMIVSRRKTTTVK
jgi:hypothetical protein